MNWYVAKLLFPGTLSILIVYGPSFNSGLVSKSFINTLKVVDVPSFDFLHPIFSRSSVDNFLSKFCTRQFNTFLLSCASALKRQCFSTHFIAFLDSSETFSCANFVVVLSGAGVGVNISVVVVFLSSKLILPSIVANNSIVSSTWVFTDCNSLNKSLVVCANISGRVCTLSASMLNPNPCNILCKLAKSPSPSCCGSFALASNILAVSLYAFANSVFKMSIFSVSASDSLISSPLAILLRKPAFVVISAFF